MTGYKYHFHRFPPLCNINPLYNQLMGLRFRALQYLSSH
ncbi:MAG: Mo-dependent nitrogenase C-terminal domain-containing protein [Scytonema sp. PMC 1069.18]|nr:Mo-dependent nitrogenase C-terminal domain-containing protein [Scytonema sp. PMC 1069.18]MEC4885087.1 Mo-dependent nitrogenase C-terminal domain-containing protein [Scytonema sp. PMC 1070.18]